MDNILKILLFLFFSIFFFNNLGGQNNTFQLNDSTNFELNNNEIKKIHIKYNFLLEQEQIKTAKEKRYKLIFALFLILIILGSAFILIRYYLKLKQNCEILKIQKREISLTKFDYNNILNIYNLSSDALIIIKLSGKMEWANKTFIETNLANNKNKDYNFIKETASDKEREIIKKCYSTKETIINELEDSNIKRYFIPRLNDIKKVTGIYILTLK